MNDPHICTIYEVGEANGRAFIVMELVEGRALNSLIPPEGLQFWALWQVLSELYRTMALVAVLSGMRSGEIFGLRWRYVDFEERSILVAETVLPGAFFDAQNGLPIAKFSYRTWLWKFSNA